MEEVNEINGTIDLFEVSKYLIGKKWYILVLVLLFTLTGILVSYYINDKYKATAIIAPSTSQSGSINQIASQFSNLASLAGVNLSASTDSKSLHSVELMKTWSFIDNFIKKENLQKTIIAAHSWDRLSNKISYDPDWYDETIEKWVRQEVPQKGITSEPTSWELYQLFIESLDIQYQEESGLYHISFSHISPVVSKNIVKLLILEINRFVQDADKQKARDNITYLKEEIKNTDLADMKNIFYQLIEEETKKLMLAEVTEDYVFRVIGEPLEPLEPYFPNRTLILLLSMILGLSFSIFLFTVKYIINK